MSLCTLETPTVHYTQAKIFTNSFTIVCRHQEAKPGPHAFWSAMPPQHIVLPPIYKKAVLSPGEQGDAAVNFDTYRILHGVHVSARTFGYFCTRVPVGYLNGYPGTRCFG